MDDRCTIGIATKSDDCHSTSYSKSKDIYNLNTFTWTDKELLRYRVNNFLPSDNDTICNHHKCKYLDYYTEKYGRNCCDPFKKHKKSIKENLRELDMETCRDYLNAFFIKLIPGQQVCANCQKAIATDVKRYRETTKEVTIANVEPVKFNLRKREMNPQQGQSLTQSQTSESSTSSLQHQNSDSSYYTSSQELEQFEKILNLAGVSRPNLNKLPLNKRQTHIEQIIGEVCSKLSSKFSTLFNIQVPNQIRKGNVRDGIWFQGLLENLQKAYKDAKSAKEKLDYLVLLPHDWSRIKICEYVPCSRYLYEILVEMRQTGGE